MDEPNDVLVIGSGVAGALVGWSLARHGLKVTIVEAGSRVERGLAVERLQQQAIWVPEAPYEAQAHAGSPTIIKDTYFRQDGANPFGSTYLRQVGGTTWHWLGTALRLLPSDFRSKTLYGIGADWPITYADLEQWYAMAETELGVAGHGESGGQYPMPGFPATVVDQFMGEAAAKLGFKAQVSPQARNSRPYDDRPGCCVSSSCIPICPVQAKYDATVHVAKAEAAGARLLADHVVVRLEAGPDDRITEVVARRPDRSEVRLMARQIVLAAHAIEGPKLLLMSRSERFPAGIANRSDAVGRHLMDHPIQLTIGVAPKPVWPRRGPMEVSSIHNMRDGAHRRAHGAFLVNIGNHGWDWPGPSLSAITQRYVNEGLSGTALQQKVRHHSARQVMLVGMTEQLPDAANRIVPDFDRLDAIGVPKPKITYKLDDYTQGALAAARTTHEHLFQAAKVTDISHVPDAKGGGHIMGTTRMGVDRKTSVANGDGRSHDHPNLWFAGSSLYPTVGTANPTLTLAALALRTAQAIKATLARG